MLQAALTSWDIRLVVLVCMAVPALLYVRGWRHLRRVVASRPARETTNQRNSLVAGWKPFAYLGGLLLLTLALVSPIDVLSSQLFTMHMVQHLLMMMVASVLMVVANPFPVVMWGLPRRPRRIVAGWLAGPSRFRRLITPITSPGVVWIAFIIIYIGWHDPNMYNLTLTNELVHDIEHMMFFGISVLFWWHVTGVAPRFHRTLSTGQRLIYVVAIVPVNMIIGVVIAFATEPIYTYYTSVPRLYGLSVMADQTIAGIIMWIPGSMMFLLIGIVLLSRIVQTEANKPLDPEPPWLVDTTTP